MLIDPNRVQKRFSRVSEGDKDFIQKYKDEIYETPPDLERDKHEADVMRVNTYESMVDTFGD